MSLTSSVLKPGMSTITQLTGALSADLCIWNFEVTTNNKLVRIVTTLQTEVLRLKTENQIFLSFLQKNEPQLLQVYYAVYMKQAPPHVVNPNRETDPSMIASNTISDVVPPTLDKQSLYMSTVDRGARMNISQRAELLQRDIDWFTNEHSAFKNKSHARKMKLKAELEEFRLRNKELDEAMRLFEEEVVTEGRNAITGRIAGEKYMRFMNEWMKNAQLVVEKVRMIRSTASSKLPRLIALIDQKSLIKMNVHEVDFEEMHIRNKAINLSYDLKTRFLLEVKHMLGSVSFVLNNYKQYLAGLLLQAKTLRKQIEYIKKVTSKFDEDTEYAKSQLTKVTQKMEVLEHLKRNYRVPPIYDYLYLKKDIATIRKHIKIKRRQTNIQEVSVKLCKDKINKLLGTELGNTLFKIIKSGRRYRMEKMIKYIFLDVLSYEVEENEDEDD